MMLDDLPLYKQVGFNYEQAIDDLLQKFTYAEIAKRIGYKSTGGITWLLNGRVPSHVHGEALWALYLETFGRKPPFGLHETVND